MNSKFIFNNQINKTIKLFSNFHFEQVEDHIKNLIFMKRRKELNRYIHIKKDLIINEEFKDIINEKMKVNLVFLRLLNKMNMNYCKGNFYYKCVNKNLNSLIKIESEIGSAENIKMNMNFMSLFLEFCNFSKNKNLLLIKHETIEISTKRKILDILRMILLESNNYTYLSINEKLKFLLFISQLNKSFFFSNIFDAEYPIENLISLNIKSNYEMENFFKFHLMCSSDFEIQSSYIDLLENSILLDKLKFTNLIDFVNLLCAQSLSDKISSNSNNFHLVLKTLKIFNYLFSIPEKEDPSILENISECYIYLIKSTIELMENLKEEQKFKVIAEILLIYNHQNNILNNLIQNHKELSDILKENIQSYMSEIYKIIDNSEDERIKIFLLFYVFKNFKEDDIFKSHERKQTKFLSCFDYNYKSVFKYLKSIDYSKISKSDKKLKENTEILLSEIIKNRKERKYVDYLFKIHTLGVIK